MVLLAPPTSRAQVWYMATHPRLIGAGIGSLVGALVILAGAVLSNLLYDRAGLSMNLWSFALIGLIAAVVALPAGAALGPWVLRTRRQTIGAGALFAIFVAAGTLVGILADALSRGADLTGLASSLAVGILYLTALGIAAAVAWVALLRAISAGPRHSIPTLVVAASLMAATILVESLTLPQ